MDDLMNRRSRQAVAVRCSRKIRGRVHVPGLAEGHGEAHPGAAKPAPSGTAAFCFQRASERAYGRGGVSVTWRYAIWYDFSMTKEQVKKVLDRVLTWPPERQEDAARVLTAMEEQYAAPYALDDEQVEEVRRRQRDFQEGRERYATDEEMAALWKKCGL
jgi:hypothetical protein